MNQRLEKLKEMEKLKPGDAFLVFAIAQEYITAGHYLQALDRFEYLLAERPDYVPTYYHAGQLYERLNNMKKAIGIYTDGIMVAKNANDLKTAGELNEALSLLTE